MKALAIGAHFDDIEIGIGGTLIRHVANGDQVWMAITSANEHRNGPQSARIGEQMDACNLLGVNEGNLLMFKKGDIVDDIVGRLDEVSPDILYIPCLDDTHQDHVRASVIGRAVSRISGNRRLLQKRAINVFFYNSGSAGNFVPNVFVAIDWAKKMELIRCFRSQNLDYAKIEKCNAFMATLTSGVEHAEGLVLGRFTLGQDRGGK